MTGLTQQPPIRGSVDTRLKVAALWIAMLFIFAYVDLSSLYRPDVRADLEAGRLFAFDVILPSLMIYLTLVKPRGINRLLNVALAAVYAVTIVAARSASGPTLSIGSCSSGRRRRRSRCTPLCG